MERIVIEIDPKVADAWRILSAERKKEITRKASIRIGKEVLETSKEEYLVYLNDLRSKMEERGLTQDILDKILNDEN